MDKNKVLAQGILENVGGKENINSVFHCATRLRFNMKDFEKINETAIKDMDGVLGIKKLGDNFQVIIGPSVGDVYDCLCELGGLKKNEEIDEKLDNIPAEKKKLTAKGVFDNVIGYVMNCMAPIIPVLIGVSIWKTIGALLGPDMLGVIAADSDFYVTCNFVFEALFYFLPLFIGYTAAKNLDVDPVWGIFIGALIITPTFIGLLTDRTTFAVFGVPVPVADYSQQFLPVIIGVWILKYVLKFLNKVVPAVISSLIVPIITVAVMTVIMFLVCAPIGSYIGQLFSTIFMFFGNAALPVKIIAMVILSALIPIMILFGMHVAIYVAAFTGGLEMGYEAFFFPSMIIACFVLYGMALGAAIKSKKNRGTMGGFALSGYLAGITEPCLYGVAMRSKKSMLVMFASCAIGGFFSGLFSLKCSLLAAVSALSVVPFYTVPAASTLNVVIGCIVAIGSSILAAIGTILFVDVE